MTVAERNRWATKLVAKHFKGGEKAFDEVWKENAGAAYCQMIEILQKANMMGAIPVFHSDTGTLCLKISGIHWGFCFAKWRCGVSLGLRN